MPLPPISVAKPIGISVAEAGVLVRTAMFIRIGSSMTTMGVLFMNALNTAVTTRISSSDKLGILVHKPPEPADDRLQRAGLLERAADDHEGADRDQRLVPEAVKEFRDVQRRAGRFVGEDLETERQRDQDDEARGFHRHALAREKDERKHGENHHRNGVCVR